MLSVLLLVYCYLLCFLRLILLLILLCFSGCVISSGAHLVGDQNFQISRYLREGHAAVCIGALDLEPEAAGADMDTHLLNLLSRYVRREAPQLGGLLAAGAQPRRRRLVAVGEVLPGHSGHRRVHRHVARRRGRLMKDETSACWSRVAAGQKNDDQVSW